MGGNELKIVDVVGATVKSEAGGASERAKKAKPDKKKSALGKQ